MIVKRIAVLSVCVLLIGGVLAGCDRKKADTAPTGEYITDNTVTVTAPKGEIVSQPTVNKADFPENYPELSAAVFEVVSTPTRKKNGKTVGCEVLNMIAESKGDITDEVKKAISKEVISKVSKQVEDVECIDADFSISPNDPDMGLLTVTFVYLTTGGVDSKIYNFPISR